MTYLRRYEPDELVRFSGDSYTTRTHDSLKISNGKWCWWSRGIGGVTALDYLIEVQGLSLPDAVVQLTGPPPYRNSAQRREKPRPPPVFELPPRHADNRRVSAYLQGRGIHLEIINHCIKHSQLYEDAEHHNCVFVGYDGETPRHAALRGTLSGSDFMGDVPGSDKRFSFAVPKRAGSGTLCVFECAIDALSYLTLLKANGRDWRSANVLSLSGVYGPKHGGGIKLPLALEQYLRDNPQIDTIILCLDSDDTGRMASGAIQRLLTDYTVWDNPPRAAKDYNELLQKRLA